MRGGWWAGAAVATLPGMFTSRPPAPTSLLCGLVVAGAALALPSAASAAGPFRTTLVNACDRAPQCSGSATDGIVGIVQASRPDVVAVNEFCRGSGRAVARRTGYRLVFTQSGPRQRCPGGRGGYGNALLIRDEPVRDVRRVTYAVQSPGPEKRTLTCVTSRGRDLCVTHLDHKGRAGRQAGAARKRIAAKARTRPTLLAGDLNLVGDAAERARPEGMWRRGDGRRLHVIGSRGLGRPTARTSTVPWSDHPVLQVDVRPR